jgi:hypothetical protein
LGILEKKMLFVRRTLLNQSSINRAIRLQRFVSQDSGSEKVEEKKIKIVLDEKDLTEKFVRGDQQSFSVYPFELNFYPLVVQAPVQEDKLLINQTTAFN